MISQSNILDKLKKLQVLIDKTDDKFGDIMLGGEIEETDLFNIIDIELLQEMNWIESYEGEWDCREVREKIIPIMRKSNLHWKFRNKMLHSTDSPVSWDDFLFASLDEKCRELALSGNKISAIKHYRKTMNEVLGKECSLKQAKERIDSLVTEADYQRGILATN
tara:strand:- start:495 stop:986 length:492 start_codon:yes stop_codon:yes gene_type:complete